MTAFCKGIFCVVGISIMLCWAACPPFRTSSIIASYPPSLIAVREGMDSCILIVIRNCGLVVESNGLGFSSGLRELLSVVSVE